ncbi:MAG: nuclear transport factor 2 family protein [Pseudomonadota bacterium]
MQVIKPFLANGLAGTLAYRINDGLSVGLRVALAIVSLASSTALSWGENRVDEEALARAQILGVVTSLFDGMREKDAALIRKQFVPNARLGTLSVSDFIERVGGSRAYLDERTFDETVLVDGDLAMAWTPYNLFIDGKFHHCGVDLFVLKRIGGQWQIADLEDTRRTENCEPHRSDPPN